LKQTSAVGGAGSASFDDKNVGDAKPVSVAGLGLTGADGFTPLFTFTTIDGSLSVDVSETVKTDFALVRASCVVTAAAVDGQIVPAALGDDRGTLDVAGAAVNAVRINATSKMKPEELQGKFIIGVLADSERPSYNEEYAKVREQARGISTEPKPPARCEG